MSSSTEFRGVTTLAVIAYCSTVHPLFGQPKTAYSAWGNTNRTDVQYRWRSVSFGSTVPTDCEVQYRYSGTSDRLAAQVVVRYTPTGGSSESRNGRSFVSLERGIA